MSSALMKTKLVGIGMKKKYMTGIRNAIYVTNSSEVIKIN
jgi:hypothetical protein